MKKTVRIAGLIIVVSLLIIFIVEYRERNKYVIFNSSSNNIVPLAEEPTARELNMKINSPAFVSGEEIPIKYTCDGEDINPRLAISDVPAATKSLALIVDDPDAPTGTWLHWTVWNIKPDTIEITENSIPAGAVEGTTDFGSIGYGGPCPPNGIHRYFFRLYALDIVLDLTAGARLGELETAMGGHIITKAELMGKYSRN